MITSYTIDINSDVETIRSGRCRLRCAKIKYAGRQLNRGVKTVNGEVINCVGKERQEKFLPIHFYVLSAPGNTTEFGVYGCGKILPRGGRYLLTKVNCHSTQRVRRIEVKLYSSFAWQRSSEVQEIALFCGAIIVGQIV